MRDRHVHGGDLRDIRERAAMLAKDLAAAAGISVWHLSEIENNHRKYRKNTDGTLVLREPYCSDQAAKRIAAVLACAVEDFTAPGSRAACTICASRTAVREAA